MSTGNEIYSFYNLKTGKIEMTNEEEIAGYIESDIENICELLGIDKMNLDRNEVFKVHRLSFKDRSFGFWYLKIGKHVQFHSLGLLRLIFGKIKGTQLYLNKIYAENDESKISSSQCNFFSIFGFRKFLDAYVSSDEYKSYFYKECEDFLNSKIFNTFISTIFNSEEMDHLIETKAIDEMNDSRMLEYTEEILKLTEMLMDDEKELLI